MTHPACPHPNRLWFPGYEYPLCQRCYDEAYAAWIARVTQVNPDEVVKLAKKWGKL